ncbi:hypothetical protein FHG87_022323 [Trinorchestia longiramus]|nr:hypothetical protein FHG87_022323 [Trinorchestia longiramus]
MATRWLRNYTVAELFRKSCNEIPEVVGASIFCLIGIVGTCYMTYKEYQIEARKVKKFKMSYVVYRPENKYVKHMYNRDTPEQREAHENDLKPYLQSPWNRA